MTDEQLIREYVAAAQDGDERAFTALYEHFAPRLFRFLAARVRTDDVEDLAQRVFLKMIEALPTYQDRGLPFGAWFFRIARNTVIDFGRTSHPALDLDQLLPHADDGPGPLAEVERSSERDRLLAALAILTTDQREVVTYRFFADMSPAEIGALMGKREGAVRILQFRALERLRAHLGADIEEIAA